MYVCMCMCACLCKVRQALHLCHSTGQTVHGGGHGGGREDDQLGAGWRLAGEQPGQPGEQRRGAGAGELAGGGLAS
jgi:hypothetical protein